jgi:3-hydroxyacyl-CoA dehydrogenase
MFVFTAGVVGAGTMGAEIAAVIAPPALPSCPATPTKAGSTAASSRRGPSSRAASARRGSTLPPPRLGSRS